MGGGKSARSLSLAGFGWIGDLNSPQEEAVVSLRLDTRQKARPHDKRISSTQSLIYYREVGGKHVSAVLVILAVFFFPLRINPVPPSPARHVNL